MSTIGSLWLIDKKQAVYLALLVKTQPNFEGCLVWPSLWDGQCLGDIGHSIIWPCKICPIFNIKEYLNLYKSYFVLTFKDICTKLIKTLLQECFRGEGSCGYFYCGIVAMFTPCLLYLVMAVIQKNRHNGDDPWWLIVLVSLTYPLWFPIGNLMSSCRALCGNVLYYKFNFNCVKTQ